MDDSTTYTALGRYRLLRKIGRGGMGEVWLAEDPRLQRQVALKILPQRNRDDQHFITRFEREARAAAALHHPHILPVHDYGQQRQPDGSTVAYLVMSYVAGGSVEDRLHMLASQQGALTQHEALDYLAQVAEAIDYAHSHGIIHRDIKPANMLLREDNWLLLTDFGIARIVTDTDSVTTTGSFLGTPTYMAPEQAQGHAVPASDIYSLAIIAYQLFTGRVPFKADSPLATTFQHAFADPTAPRVYNPTLPLAFEVALLRGMAKSPAQRPPSATAFVTSLRQALDSGRVGSVAVSPFAQPAAQTEPPRPAPRMRRRKVLLGAGAGALLVGGGVTAYALSSLKQRKPVVPVSTGTRKPSPTASARANAPLVLASAFSTPVKQMAWSPEKQVLATYNRQAPDNQVLLWEMPAAGQSNTPRQVAHHIVFDGTDDVFLAWSPNGKMLAMANAGYDGETSQYETLLYASDLSRLVTGISSTSFTSDRAFNGVSWAAHNYVLTVSNRASSAKEFDLHAWNVQKPQQKPFTTTVNIELTPDFSTTLNLVAVAPNGSTVAIGTLQGLLPGTLDTSHNPVTWRQLAPVLPLHDLAIDALSWSADGQYVAALNSDNSVVSVWDATRQYQRVLPDLDTSQIAGQLKYLAWSPVAQSPTLALGGTEGLVYLWNVGGSATVQRTLPGNITDEITALAWSHDGQWLAASYKDVASSILFWRM